MSLWFKLFHFNPDDLNYNRRGLLSPAQRQRWQRERVQLRLGLLFMLFFLLAIALIAMFSGGFGYGLALLAICLLMVASLWVMQRREQRLQAIDRVRRITGSARLSRTRDSNHSAHWLHIGDQKFLVSRAAFHRLERGATYTVYYVPGWNPGFLPLDNRLVAIEVDDTISAE
ncbi:MAG: hypothetical protein HC910_01210 [Spirulinaceae cyanobacterium SM2_1_0]|nr:hypothetical protein [Spirulinaceae cyanobacterium SM2_1_0]